MVNATGPITSTEANTLVQNLFKEADTNHDGQISSAEFMAFLSTALGAASTSGTSSSTSASPLAAAIAAGTNADGSPAYLDTLDGFDLSRMQSAADSPKYAFANLAQYLAPNQANLDAIAQQLGPGKGYIDTDGMTYMLYDSDGYIGVRDDGNGPMWQWMAYNDAHPDPGVAAF